MKNVVAMVAPLAGTVLLAAACGTGSTAGTLAPSHGAHSAGGSPSAAGHGILLVKPAGVGKSPEIVLWRPGSPARALAEGGGCEESGYDDHCVPMSDGYWSPDGRSIAFERDAAEGLAPPFPGIVVMRSNGTREETLPDKTGDWDGATFGPPSWSPDGRRVVYEQQLDSWETGASLLNFVVVDVRSGQVRTVSASGSDPVWGTPGIAYFTASGITLLNPATGYARLVTRGFKRGTLAWSPGGVLAVGGPRQVVLLAASGSVLGELPIPAAAIGSVCGVAWAPDGKQILVSSTKNGTTLGGLWVVTVSTKRWERISPMPAFWRKTKFRCAVSWR